MTEITFWQCLICYKKSGQFRHESAWCGQDQKYSTIQDVWWSY